MSTAAAEPESQPARSEEPIGEIIDRWMENGFRAQIVLHAKAPPYDREGRVSVYVQDAAAKGMASAWEATFSEAIRSAEVRVQEALAEEKLAVDEQVVRSVAVGAQIPLSLEAAARASPPGGPPTTAATEPAAESTSP